MDYVCENYQISKEKAPDRTSALAAYGKVYAEKKAEISGNASKEDSKDA